MNISTNPSGHYNSLNSTPPTLADPAKVLIWTIVTMSVCIAGCFTNGFVLYATWPRPGEKSGVNLLIIHYIIANMLNCLIHYPARCLMVQARTTGYSPSISVCYFIQTANSVNWFVVLYADAGLSINRCVALFAPHRYPAFFTGRKNALQIILMWSASSALVMPFNFGAGGFVTILAIGHCAFHQTKSPYVYVYNLFKYTPFVIAVSASLVLCVKCYTMSRYAERQPHFRALDRQYFERLRRRIRLAAALVLSNLWTIICIVPPNIVIAVFPVAFEREPTANLWLQTGAVAQYAFAAGIFLLADPKYVNRLRKITPRISALNNSFTSPPVGASNEISRKNDPEVLHSLSNTMNILK